MDAEGTDEEQNPLTLPTGSFQTKSDTSVWLTDWPWTKVEKVLLGGAALQDISGGH